MDFKMEELVPLVTRLTRRYTSMESSSVTYETAQMLMEAVIYCIEESLGADSGGVLTAGSGVDAAVCYQEGYRRVIEKVRRARELYDQLIKDFDDYCCSNYHATVLDGMPAFFLYYDAEFKPQDHLLTVDYPTLVAVKAAKGIDLIYEYLLRITWEKELLGQFDRDAVIRLLSNLIPDYQESYMDNLCYPVLLTALLCIIADQPVRYLQLEPGDRETIRQFFAGDSSETAAEKFRRLINLLAGHFHLQKAYLARMAGTYSQIWSSFLDQYFGAETL